MKVFGRGRGQRRGSNGFLHSALLSVTDQKPCDNWKLKLPQQPYLSGLPLDTSAQAIEDVDSPLVVVLQRCTHRQFPKAIAVHVGQLGQRRAQTRVLGGAVDLQCPLEDE